MLVSPRCKIHQETLLLSLSTLINIFNSSYNIYHINRYKNLKHSISQQRNHKQSHGSCIQIMLSKYIAYLRSTRSIIEEVLISTISINYLYIFIQRKKTCSIIDSTRDIKVNKKMIKLLMKVNIIYINSASKIVQ